MIAVSPTQSRRIDSLRPGDTVLTRSGPRKVTHVASRIATVGTTTFENNRTLRRTILRGTHNHPVLTQRGWVNLGELELSDCVIGASSTTGQSSTPTEATTSRREDVFIASSTRRHADRFLLDTMFIIATRTSSIMNQIISSAFRMMSTVASTLSRQVPNLLASTGPVFHSYRPSAQTAPHRSSAETSRISQQSARVVGRYVQTRNERPAESAGAAAQSSDHGVETTVLNVVSIWAPEDEDCIVYDLRVEDVHEFVANGVVVHNCDELGAWDTTSKPGETSKGEATLDMLLFGLRLGKTPRIVITTTPRTNALVRKLIKDAKTVMTHASTYANKAHLPQSILDEFRRKYEGTRLGRQELYAELLEDIVGALWTDEMIKHLPLDASVPYETFQRIVVAVDPSGSKNDSIGIVVAAVDHDGHFWVIADRTTSGSPAQWGKAAVDAYYDYEADRLVAESNFGGAMVEATVRNVDSNVSYKEVRASRGKVLRAEPISALYEQGRVTHVRGMEELEKQMMLMSLTGFQGEGSPDRVDALVWALTDLSGRYQRTTPDLLIDGERRDEIRT